MKAISVYDLQVIEELAHLSIFDLVHPDNDKVVKPFLEIMGFDTEYPLHYTVSQHRTWANEVKIGYVIRGEVSIARKDLNGPWGTVLDKLVAADYQGGGLLQDMLSLMSTKLDYNAFHDCREPDPETLEQFPACLKNPDELELLAQIRQLEDILFEIRGNPYASDGNLRMPGDVDEAPYKQRAKRAGKDKKMKKEH
jgi:hypothetical protein